MKKSMVAFLLGFVFVTSIIMVSCSEESNGVTGNINNTSLSKIIEPGLVIGGGCVPPCAMPPNPNSNATYNWPYSVNFSYGASSGNISDMTFRDPEDENVIRGYGYEISSFANSITHTITAELNTGGQQTAGDIYWEWSIPQAGITSAQVITGTPTYTLSFTTNGYSNPLPSSLWDLTKIRLVVREENFRKATYDAYIFLNDPHIAPVEPE